MGAFLDALFALLTPGITPGEADGILGATLTANALGPQLALDMATMTWDGVSASLEAALWA